GAGQGGEAVLGALQPTRHDPVQTYAQRLQPRLSLIKAAMQGGGAEAARRLQQAALVAGDPGLKRGSQTVGGAAQAVLSALDAGAQQAGRQATGGDRQLSLMHGDIAVQARAEAAGGVVQPLLRQGQQVFGPGGQAARGGAQAGATVLQHPRPGARQTALQIAERPAQIGQHRRGDFGRPGRSRRPAVGDEVDEGGVGLVPDGRDYGDAGGSDRARQTLVVEAPQVLDRAAAARDDQQVRAGDRPVRRHLVEAADG